MLRWLVWWDDLCSFLLTDISGLSPKNKVFLCTVYFASQKRLFGVNLHQMNPVNFEYIILTVTKKKHVLWNEFRCTCACKQKEGISDHKIADKEVTPITLTFWVP